LTSLFAATDAVSYNHLQGMWWPTSFILEQRFLKFCSSFAFCLVSHASVCSCFKGLEVSRSRISPVMPCLDFSYFWILACPLPLFRYPYIYTSSLCMLPCISLCNFSPKKEKFVQFSFMAPKL
jgi:hypothetical protein